MATDTLDQTTSGTSLTDRLQSINDRSTALSNGGTSGTVTPAENQTIARAGNVETSSTNGTGDQTIARGGSTGASRLRQSVPSTGPWSTALYNVDTQELTVTRYQDGRQVGNPVTARGTFTGGGNDISTENSRGGAVTRGGYDIREMKPNERTPESTAYRNNYPNTTRDWLVLDPRDSNRGDDVNQANGRDGVRLHAGRGSLGCVTVPASQKTDWQRIESTIPRGRAGQVVGRMEVIGGDRASTGTSTTDTVASTTSGTGASTQRQM